MHLLEFKRGRHWAVCLLAEVGADGESECGVLDQLEGLEQERLLTVEKIFAGLDYGVNDVHGLKALKSAKYHEAHAFSFGGHAITFWEYIQGKCRLYCFHDAGNIVVAFHAIKKKGNQTAKGDKSVMEAVYRKYIAATKAGPLKIVKPE